MSDPLLQPVLLTTVPTEGAAATIVCALESEGLRAWKLGGTPMEGPNAVNIMVLGADEALARAVLEVVRAEAGTIDWDAVDVETASETVGGERPAMPGASARAGARVASPFTLGGLGTVGAGAGMISVRDLLFGALPAAAKPVPGCVLVAAGVVWCVAKARRYG